LDQICGVDVTIPFEVRSKAVVRGCTIRPHPIAAEDGEIGKVHTVVAVQIAGQRDRNRIVNPSGV
jgi:hypothetical protein